MLSRYLPHYFTSFSIVILSDPKPVYDPIARKISNLALGFSAPSHTAMTPDSEIRIRINSITDTKKVTDAMFMISSVKMRKAKAGLEGTKPYFDALKAIGYTGGVSCECAWGEKGDLAKNLEKALITMKGLI